MYRFLQHHHVEQPLNRVNRIVPWSDQTDIFVDLKRTHRNAALTMLLSRSQVLLVAAMFSS
jgi:hypothetical protein